MHVHVHPLTNKEATKKMKHSLTFLCKDDTDWHYNSFSLQKQTPDACIQHLTNLSRVCMNLVDIERNLLAYEDSDEVDEHSDDELAGIA